MLPAILVLGSILFAAAATLGCDSRLFSVLSSLTLLQWMFRLQWVFIVASVGASMGIVALVTTGRRRTGWLVALLPVVGLFAWRFAYSPDRAGTIEVRPVFVRAAEATQLRDDELVAGLIADDQPYAFPLAGLSASPVVVHTLRENRLFVTWSQPIGLATAAWVDRSVQPQELQIVGRPAGVLMLFNARVGEFFDVLTFHRPGGAALTGFQSRLNVDRLPWSRWKQLHADTLVWRPARASAPVLALPATGETVCIVESPVRAIVPSIEIGGDPVNLGAGESAVVLLREGGFGRVRAFARRVDGDLFLRFKLETPTGKKQQPRLMDVDTGSEWNFGGLCIDGPLKGRQLAAVTTIDGVSSAAARFWTK